MTPEALLASLRACGLSVRREGGRLLVSPAAKLTGEQKDELITHRAALLALLEAEDALADEAGFLAAERAWFDPPDFGEKGAVLRESEIIRCEGLPTIAVAPGSLEAWQAHNRWARERQAEKQHAREAQQRPKKPDPQTFIAPPGHTEENA